MSVKIITCAGYYGTGSSAVTDLLGEFDNIHYQGDYEVRFVQDPNGISDLEYNLVENPHRHNSGYALKKFKHMVDFLNGNTFIKRYNVYFNNQFKSISYDYISSLTDFTYKGVWHQDVIDKGMFFWFITRSINKLFNLTIARFFKKGSTSDSLNINFLKNEITYVTFPGQKFYSITREYIDKLFSAVNVDNKDYIMVDQLVPPSNLSRYLCYFNNLKVVVVDRDPRDIYILEKLYWKGDTIPSASVEDFALWYKLTRSHNDSEKDDINKVLRIKFEDMVYNYEETINHIISFLSLDNKKHTMSKKLFNPQTSILNTQLWKQHPELKADIAYLSNELSRYCYHFPT